MASVFEDYTNRTKSHARNLRERVVKDTQTFIMDNFDDAPTYREIQVRREDGPIEIYGVRVNMIERMGNIRNILLKPHDDLDVGNMAFFENRTWLLYDKFGYRDSGVKITAMRTNYNLTWMDANGIVQSKRCYASSSDIGSKSKQSRANIEYNKYDVKLPYGQLYIFIETTEATKSIDLNHRFIINDIVYEVIGVDNTTHVEDDYGVIQFTVKRVTKHPKDDFDAGLAYNAYTDNGDIKTLANLEESKWEDELEEKAELEEDDGRGGFIW